MVKIKVQRWAAVGADGKFLESEAEKMNSPDAAGGAGAAQTGGSTSSSSGHINPLTPSAQGAAGGASSSSRPGTPAGAAPPRSPFNEDQPAKPSQRPDIAWFEDGGYFADTTATNWVVHADGMPQMFFSHDDQDLEKLSEQEQRRQRFSAKGRGERDALDESLLNPETPYDILQRTKQDSKSFWEGEISSVQLLMKLGVGLAYASVPIASLAHLFVNIFVHNVLLDPAGPSTRIDIAGFVNSSHR